MVHKQIKLNNNLTTQKRNHKNIQTRQTPLITMEIFLIVHRISFIITEIQIGGDVERV